MVFYRTLGQYAPACTASAPVPLDGNADGVSTGVLVLKDSDRKADVQAMKRHRRRHSKQKMKPLSRRQQMKAAEQADYEKLVDEIRALYPQCDVCRRHCSSAASLDQHACAGPATRQDALSKAMRYADAVVAERDFTVTGAIKRAENLYEHRGYASAECMFAECWAFGTKDMQPNITERVRSIAKRCWAEGKDSNNKISADAVVAKLEAMYQAGELLLSEVPVAGHLRARYQSIGAKADPLQPQNPTGVVLVGDQPHAPIVRRKRGRPPKVDGGGTSKKPRPSYHALDQGKPVPQWKKPELEAYLRHHDLNSYGNKPELITRVTDHMKMSQGAQQRPSASGALQAT
jgi:hypothetical protein